MSDPISAEYLEQMNRVAGSLDRVFNGDAKGPDRKVGFALFVFPFGGPDGQRTNYISNSDRRAMIVALKEVLARFEGQPHVKGRG